MTEAASQTGDGTGNGIAGDVSKPTWIEQLPEVMRGDQSLYGYQTIGDFVTAHKTFAAEREGSIKVPGENATDAERAAFMTALGRPETADQYSFGKPEGLPEGLVYTPEAEQMFKGYFHELGLSDKQATALWWKYHEVAGQGFTAQQQADRDATDKAVETLKTEWPGDAFKVNTELAHRAFMKTFEKPEQQTEAKTFLETAKVGGIPLGDHPMFLRVFAHFGKIISDDSANAGRNGGGQGGSDEAKAASRFPNTTFPQ